MTTLKIIALFVWLMAGILTLMGYSDQKGVSKLSYILCWISLLCFITEGIFQ